MIDDILLPLMKLLPKPNPEQDWQALRTQLHTDFVLMGKCFLWTVKNLLGAIAEAWRLNPFGVAMVMPNGDYRYSEDGWKTSVVIPAGGVIAVPDPYTDAPPAPDVVVTAQPT